MCKGFSPENMGILGIRCCGNQFYEFRINMRYASQQKIVHNAVKYFIVSVCILEVNKST
jgi:hypothetical protein